MRTSTDISWKMPENREHEKAGKTVKTEENAKVSVTAGLGEAAGFREAERAESDAAVKEKETAPSEKIFRIGVDFKWNIL